MSLRLNKVMTLIFELFPENSNQHGTAVNECFKKKTYSDRRICLKILLYCHIIG